MFKIITSGGENIAPVPIEENIKKELEDVLSNVVVVGDGRKFLTCMVTLKVEVDPMTQKPSTLLTDSTRAWAQRILPDSSKGVETLDDFINGEHADELQEALEAGSFKLDVFQCTSHDFKCLGLLRANEKASSRAHKVQKIQVLPTEFSVETGELGPALKLKRYFVYEKFQDIIDQIYEEDLTRKIAHKSVN